MYSGGNIVVFDNKKALIITRKHQYPHVVIVKNVNLLTLAETAGGNNNTINILHIINRNIIFTNNVNILSNLDYGVIMLSIF